MKKSSFKCIAIFMTLLIVSIYITPLTTYADTAYERQQTIYKYLTQNLGFSTGIACGFIANMSAENGIFEPNRNQVGMTFGAGGYGIIQWEGTRRTRLKTWCSNNGYSHSTLNGQLAYLEYELSIYPYKGSNLLQWFKGNNYGNDANGAYEAAKFICTDYVGPENAASKALERGKLARDIFYPQYGGNSNDQIATVPTCTTGDITVKGHELTLSIKIDTYGGDAKVNKIGWFVRKTDSSETLYEPIMTGTFSKIGDGGLEYTKTIEVEEVGTYVVRAYAETVYGRGQAENTSTVQVSDPPSITTGTIITEGKTITLSASITAYGGDARVNKIGWFVRKTGESTVLYEPIITGDFLKVSDGGKEYTKTIIVAEPGEYVIRAYAETVYGRGQAASAKQVTIYDDTKSQIVENNSSISSDDFTLYIPDLELDYADEITIPIMITSNTGVSNFGFTLLYDSTVLKPLYVENGNAWKSELVCNLNYDVGQIFISSSADSNKAINGTFIEATFIVKQETEKLYFSLDVDEFGKITSPNNILYYQPNTQSGTVVFNKKLDYTFGDVNNDGKIDSGDATLVLLHYAKLKMLDNELAGDINKDGKVDSADATLILLHYAGLKKIED